MTCKSSTEPFYMRTPEPGVTQQSQGPASGILRTFDTRSAIGLGTNCQQVLKEMILMPETGHLQWLSPGQ